MPLLKHFEADKGASRAYAAWLVGVALCMAVALLLAPQHLWNRVLPQADLAFHVAWVSGIRDALEDRVWYPRWLPEQKLGLGAPVFLYYPPGYAFTAAHVSRLLDLDVWAAMGMVEWTAALLSAWGMFLCCRPIAGTALATIAGLLFIGSPMLVGLLYSFNARPWFVASAPAVLMLCRLLAPGRSFLDWRMAVAVALLITTHVLSALIFLLCLPAFFLTQPRWKHGMLRFTLSAALGAALASVYLLPALTNLPLIRTDAWHAGVLDWRGSFIFPVITSWLFRPRWFSYQWVVPASMLAATSIAALYLRHATSRSAEGEPETGLAAVCGFAFFLSSELAYPLWAMFPFLQKVQFPYRFLYVVAILLPVLVVSCMKREFSGNKRLPWMAALLVAASLPVATSVMIMGRSLIDSEPIQLALPRLQMASAMGAPEYLPAKAGPQWINWVRSGGFPAEATQAGVRILWEQRGSRAYDWLLDARSPARIRLPVFSFPAWRVELNGKRLHSVADPDTGLIQIRLSSGSHRVRLRWDAAPWEREGLFLSSLALMLVLCLALSEAFLSIPGRRLPDR